MLIPDAVVCGDNLEWLPLIADESVDMCYIDPPFFTNRDFIEFNDKFSSMYAYIEWMRPRIELIHQKLRKTGSIFLHCDWHASHRLRCLLDDVFGEKNFVNEIVWSYKRWPIKGKFFQRMHDTIYFYEKGEKSDRVFQVMYGPRAESTLKRWKDKKIKANHVDGKRVPSTFEHKASEGVPLSDVFEIPIIAPVSKERLGYPTQKPEALIKRIIECSTNEGDVVLDCFAGSGTTAKVAKDLNRRYIVGDVSSLAVTLIKKRIYAE